MKLWMIFWFITIRPLYVGLLYEYFYGNYEYMKFSFKISNLLWEDDILDSASILNTNICM